jgi:hypothetical protein
MFKRDYLMKQIEQLASVLHQIMFHKEHKQFDDAIRLLDEASRHLLGLGLRSLQALSTADILKLLTYQEVTDTGKAILLSDLLKEQGEIHDASGDGLEAYASRVKVLDVLLELHRHHRENDESLIYEINQRIEVITSRLGKLDLPVFLKQKLIPYYEENGAYAKVEDMLFYLLEDLPNSEEIKGQGLSFYQSLLEKDAAELQKGNFSMLEAEEGLRLLQGKLI